MYVDLYTHSMLQCVAGCCSALQCGALWRVLQNWAHIPSLIMSLKPYGNELQESRETVCCSVLQFVAVCCSVLHCAAVCCSVLQCVVFCRSQGNSVLKCAAVCCSVLLCIAVYCSVLQCVAECCIL